MAEFAQILIRAKDETKTAFDSAERNMRGLQNSATKLGGLLRSVSLGAGLSVAGFAAFAKSGIDAADAMQDMSDRIGVSVKDLTSFKLAAELADTSLEGVGNGISRLSRSIGEAENGNKKMAETLSTLGITARDPKEAFIQLADAVQRIQDPSKRAALLSQVLGKSYQELVPLLNQGGEALRKSAKESESFAEAMSRLAPEAGKLNDQLDILKDNAAKASASILSKLVPSFNEWIAVGQEVVKTGTLLDKVRFFGIGNASDEMVRRVRLNVVAASGWADKLRESAARLGEEKPDEVNTPDVKPSAKSANRSSLIDALETGSFKTYSKDVAAFIREQQDAINGLNSDIAKTITLYDALGSGSYLADSASSVFIREQQESINDLNREIAQSLDEQIPKLEQTKSLAEEIGLTFTSAFEDAIAGGEDFGDVLKALEQDIAKLLVRKAVTEPLMGAIDNIDFGSLFGFANGGIMTGSGPLPLRKYAGGGIASTPQLAVFGEGSMAEAFVPLPDGRRIPVQMKGGMGGNVQVVINNTTGMQANSRERQENGVRVIEVFFEQYDSWNAKNISQGRGATAGAMEKVYGLNRAPGAYR